MATAPPSGIPPQPLKSASWNRLSARANSVASIVVLFVCLIAIGAVTGFIVSQSRKNQSAKGPTIQTLSQEDIAKLSQVGANLGTTGQTLNIGANTLIRGKGEVTGGLTIGGPLNANGPVTLSQLNITGNTATTGLSVGSNLLVTGATTIQKSLTVGDLVSAAALDVTGATSVNSLNAASIAVRTLNISGPLTISHLTTQGPAPTIAGGTALGSGGTASISGNDTAGTINFNIGTAPPAGILGTITFRAAYGSTVHILLTTLTSAAAATPVYVSRTAAGFQIHTIAVPAAGTLSFDYLVTS